jgi:hypothetical protein
LIEERDVLPLWKKEISLHVLGCIQKKKYERDQIDRSVKTKPELVLQCFNYEGSAWEGYYPDLIRCMAKTFQSNGISEIFIDVERENTASIRGVEKAGFNKVISVRLKITLSRSKYSVTVFDNPVWSGLSEEVEYYHGGTSVHQVITHGS